MDHEWHASEGMVLLLEPEGERTCLTGTVVGEHDGHPVLDLGADAKGADLYRHLVVMASAFSPDALWRLHGTLRPADDDPMHATLAELWPDSPAERIQRRLVPRRAMDLPVHVFDLDGDDAWHAPVPGRTVDVGPGGLRLRVGEQLPAACDPTVHLTLPDGYEVVALASIVDAEERAHGWEYRLVFTALGGQDREVLDRLARS